jgi:copper chaperone NosL
MRPALLADREGSPGRRFAAFPVASEHVAPIVRQPMQIRKIMPSLSRVLVAISSLLLIGLFVFPLWHVRLTAPQYPEGLGMNIRINTIEGATETDLNNINGLNHYIGMKRIDPDTIPELKFMPWIVGGLILSGLAVAAAARRRVLYVWLAGFLALGSVGLVDFWRWEYDYGHNLDAATAIIKIPGMSYQPPLLGTKQLLNFQAVSLPGAGGILAAVAFLLGVFAVVQTVRRTRSSKYSVA